MYDSPKIIMGIIIFLALFTIPFWYSQITGDADVIVERELSEKAQAAGECVEDVDYMRGQHMDLLNNWRGDVVRGADRAHEYNGKTYDKSLTDTCLEQCHTNKADFCDQCHDYVNVNPGCWDCHVVIDTSAEGD